MGSNTHLHMNVVNAISRSINPKPHVTFETQQSTQLT
jgi:hypothetical protein